jgi:hypothetical protein
MAVVNNLKTPNFIIAIATIVIAGLVLNSISSWASSVDKRIDRLEQLQIATAANQTSITSMQRQMDRIETKIDQHISAPDQNGPHQ